MKGKTKILIILLILAVIGGAFYLNVGNVQDIATPKPITSVDENSGLSCASYGTDGLCKVYINLAANKTYQVQVS